MHALTPKERINAFYKSKRIRPAFNDLHRRQGGIELGISRSFLAKILQNLARAGLLNSFKGAKGGFVLARNADEITLSEIIKSAERRKATVFDCTAEGIDACPNGRTLCRVNLMFGELQEKVDEYMDTITLANIIGKERK